MNKNGWQEQPLLGIDSVTAMFFPTGTKAYRKGNLKLLYSPVENHPDGLWKYASISHHARYPT
jgi:hypothetical protein